MTVQADIIVVRLTHKHCGAMKWSLVRVGGCNEKVSYTFTHVRKTRNHNRKGVG